jgi:GT2 family glycosyltransferase|tara:strand:- start:1543 stop:2238 length:696 start_codon:yes stop_codon:yes gene_type:complete
MTRTIIIILTWNRLFETKETIETLLEKNKGNMRDILFIDNASTDDTIQWIQKRDYDVIQNKENEGIFMASKKGWEEAVKRGYDYILNLQNDFPSLVRIPFDDIELYLDKNSDIGFVKLNKKKKKPGRDKNQVTGKRIKVKKWEKFGKTEFAKTNHHFTFNPTVFRATMVEKLMNPIEKTRERQIMERCEEMGYKAATINPETLDAPGHDQVKNLWPCFKTKIRGRMKDWKH